MFLNDRDIRARLVQLNITTGSERHQFDPDRQIQPASIDLSLSNVFWIPRKRFQKNRLFTLDLSHGRLLEVDPRRYWRRIIVREGNTIALKPGEIIFGRTHEEFSIPRDCAGVIFGRSSFARLGLSVTCSGNYVNPNYRGRMPLQLVNNGPYTIRVVPFLGVCQLCIVKLDAEPQTVYGDPELGSKYMNDDGGPSYWWRDSKVADVIRKMRERNITLDKLETIATLFTSRDPEIMVRFDEYIRSPKSDRASLEETLIGFAQRETWRRRMRSIRKYALLPIVSIATLAITLLLKERVVELNPVAITGAAIILSIALCLVIYAYMFEIGPHISNEDVERMLDNLSRES